jgi:hypothetical protein
MFHCIAYDCTYLPSTGQVHDVHFLNEILARIARENVIDIF